MAALSHEPGGRGGAPAAAPLHQVVERNLSSSCIVRGERIRVFFQTN